MGRLFLILVGIALLVWAAEFYYSSHPGAESPSDSTGSPSTAPGQVSAANGGASPSATPDHTVATCREALRKQTQTLLLPLDQNKDFSPGETTRVLQDTQRDLMQYRRDPDYQHLVQACGVLAQLMLERQNYAQRYARDSAAPAPSGSPSSLRTSSLEPAKGVAPVTLNTTTFFKDRVAAEWTQRCAVYKPVLDGLLVATATSAN